MRSVGRHLINPIRSTVRKIDVILNKTKIKQFRKTVLLQPKQNAKTAVKRSSCFSKSQPISAVCGMAGKQRIETVIG